MKTNKEILEAVAKHNGVTLEQLVYGYLTDDNIKSALDLWMDNVNSRRVPNGGEKVCVNFELLGELSNFESWKTQNKTILH